MENKKIDNKITKKKVITPKEKINQIERKIEKSKQKQKIIQNLTEEYININKNFNQCIELLLLSMKSKNTNYMFNEMIQSNNNNLHKISSIIEDEENKIKRNINDLYSEKTKLEKESKKQQND